MKSWMLFSILCVVAGPAFAGTAGHVFCSAMKQQHVSCIKEAWSKDDDGKFLTRCPVAQQQVALVYKYEMTQASDGLQQEIQTALAIWLNISNDIAPRVSEARDDYIKRGSTSTSAIDAECYKLRALD